MIKDLVMEQKTMSCPPVKNSSTKYLDLLSSVICSRSIVIVDLNTYDCDVVLETNSVTICGSFYYYFNYLEAGTVVIID